MVVWCSDFGPSLETARILRDTFSSEIVIKENLRSGKGFIHDFDWLKSELDSFDGPSLIVVSQVEYVERFPVFIGCTYEEVPQGNGLLISPCYKKSQLIIKKTA